MLYASYCEALGRPLPSALEQTYRGVKWIHLRGDLKSALHYMRRGELGVGEWWRSLRGPKAYAVFSWRDPGPFLAQLREVLRRRQGTRR